MKALTKYALFMGFFCVYLAYLYRQDKKAAVDMSLLGALCAAVTAVGYEVSE